MNAQVNHNKLDDPLPGKSYIPLIRTILVSKTLICNW